MGSHTRVAPWGKTISTRVVTSKPRHFSAWRGLKGSCCASASFGNAAAAGNIAPPVFRNARLSMSVLRSIEALSHNADPGVPTRARAEYPVSVAAKGAEAGERKLQESGGRARKQGRRCRYRRRSAKFRASPQAARSRSSPRATASYVKSGVAGGSSARDPADTDEFHSGQSTPKSSPTTSRSGPLRRASARGKKLFDRIFNGLRIPLQIARHGVADALLGVEHQGRGQHLHLPRRRRGGVAVEQHGEAHRDFLQELVDPGNTLAEVDGEDREGLARELVLQPLHRGHLLAAGFAPGCPEIEHYHLAAVIGELVLFPLQVAQREGRRGAAAPGLQLAARGPRRAARRRQKRRQEQC